jgi:diguanylate cyclase (GGDEF)-like protein
LHFPGLFVTQLGDGHSEMNGHADKDCSTMWLAWMDNRTLFASQTLITLVYAVAFLGMRWMNRHLRGTGSFALAFFSGFLGCVLSVIRGSVPNFVSVVVEHFLIFSAFVLFYRGILVFFRSPRTTRFLWLSISAALVLLMYFTTADDRIAPRIVIVSLLLFLSRSLIAIELFRQAGQRLILNVFAVLMAVYAAFGAGRSLITILHGPPYDLMQTSHFQTPSLVVNLFFICIIGLFLLLMLSSELVAIVEAQSLQDHVSGALNRRGIDQRLALELARAKRNGYELAIALIDIDHFKQINDTAGHAAGDAALRQVVGAISSRLRSYDFFGRYGGDEFLLVLPKTSGDDALKIAKRVERAVSGVVIPRFAFPVTLSIGLTFANPCEPAASMIARADMALYNAKRAGRNCTRILLASTSEGNFDRASTDAEPSQSSATISPPRAATP